MTTYNYSSDIPQTARTNLEALALWSIYTLYSLYPEQRYKEVGNADPIRAIQVNNYKFEYENNKNFIIARLVFPMADDWELLSNKVWSNAQSYPNSISITGNQKYTLD